MQIIILANGILEDPQAELTRWREEGDLLIAADGGTLHALTANCIPQHVIGDLDSLPVETQARLENAGTVFHRHPPAKDATDLELALLWAAQQRASRSVVLGALGGRPDQAQANLLLLALPALAGREVLIADAKWIIRVIRGGETLDLTGAVGDTLSLIPLAGAAHGVTTSGLRYPLHDETLDFGASRGVSNVFATREASVTLTAGLLWCFYESN